MRLRLSSAAVAAASAVIIAGSSLAAAPATGQWAPLGPTYPRLFDTVTPGALDSVQGSKVGPDGRLYFYGSFENAGGDPTADNIAVYDPATNSVVGLGSNGNGDGAIVGTVYDAVFVGATLYVGGGFSNVAGIAGANGLAAWTGTAWTGWAGTSNTVLSLATQGGRLYVSGGFVNWGGVPTADNIAIWDGVTWSGLGATPITNVVDQVLPLSDGRVFAVGRFDNAGGNTAADRAAWWDPGSSSWQPVAGTASGFFTDDIYAIAVSGSRIILGGRFLDAGGMVDADRIVEWTGTAWKAYDQAAGVAAIGGGVVADIQLYGSNVIVSGSFPSVGGLSNTAALAVFNGTKWMAAGSLQALIVASSTVTGRTLYASTATKVLANGAAGIAAYGLPAAPSGPRSPHATAGTRRVSLSWTAPSTANGASIKDYVIQYRRKGTTTWLTFDDGVRTTRTAVVTGLTTGRTYQFLIRAKNDWGTGGASIVVTATAR
jgi:hypothetical protein